MKLKSGYKKLTQGESGYIKAEVQWYKSEFISGGKEIKKYVARMTTPTTHRERLSTKDFKTKKAAIAQFEKWIGYLQAKGWA